METRNSFKGKMRCAMLITLILAAFSTGAYALPDLTIANLTYSPEEIISGDTVTIAATVENIGPDDASDIYVMLYLDGNTWDYRYISYLASESSETVYIYWTAQPGTHNLEVIADDYYGSHYIDEENETNNAASLDLPFILAPDLISAELRIRKLYNG
jgi:subtilase family serine protease